MITYVYRCKNHMCEYEYEIEQRITDNPIKLCPQCENNTCERLICEPVLILDNSPKTVGTLAERNSKKMGKYELEKKQQIAEQQSKNYEKTNAEKASGGKRVTANKKPWYKKQNTVTPKQIQKMTTKQQNKFIFEGK